MSLKLGPVVGSTTHKEAKIWVQTHRPAKLECRVYTDPGGSKQVPDSPFAFQTEERSGCTGVVTVALPQDDSKYYYSIFEKKGSSSVAISQINSFRSFPDPKKKIESVSFALVSCNKPTDFKYEKELSLRNMWRHLFVEMSRNDTSFLLAVGDQVYADHERRNAWQESVDGPPHKTPLDLYRDVYYTHWSFPEIQMVLGNFPSFMIWDDHEITNGWGSSIRHGEKRSQEIFLVARKAYEEFQHSHNPAALSLPKDHKPTPDHRPYYYAFKYGPVAFLVLDLRGNRRIWDGQLLGTDQWAALRRWFASKEAKDSKILFVVSSVPMIHLRRLFGWLWWMKTDIADQWSSPHNTKERRELLSLLFDKYVEKGKRQVFILGGDVHVGTVAKITDRASGQSIHQFTSSPISNKPERLLDSLLKRFSSKFSFRLDNDGNRYADVEIYKRYRQRNFGIITVSLGSPPNTTLKMYQEKEGQPDETVI
ncbi:MAG TPA: alkaline phosphatase D family protein [Candidatus Avalokitesvara rifleensis]|uniref:alkaline phosphatase D family protein n=1 Tax=Candidatus Avalokitesvara rifleensis TaxID=3367620 RepID=UPI0027130D0F|nr:alkaline phosphatase D family protein [Candidatus Brocadiales bacterium]